MDDQEGLAPGSDPSRDNPWLGQGLPEQKAHRSQGGQAIIRNRRRAFTDDEVARLIYSETIETRGDPLLVVFMKIAALSGMRIEEIASLQVNQIDLDTHGGIIDLRFAKTEAGARIIPIHSDLAPIFERHIAERDPSSSEWLFASLPVPGVDTQTERSMPMSKRFTRHRRRLGIEEKFAGQRQSNVVFHSFRKWFITKAERARIPPHVISAVVGHEEGRQGMTLSVYSAGPSIEDQMRECVEAVRLPKAVSS